MSDAPTVTAARRRARLCEVERRDVLHGTGVCTLAFEKGNQVEPTNFEGLLENGGSEKASIDSKRNKNCNISKM
jgi:hypothetical protein